MEISDVRVRLVRDSKERLKAVCSITLDREFVVRDVKIVEGTNGLFVAMPSRKLSVACPKCRTQNHLRARCCNECGAQLPAARIPCDQDGREKVHRDIAHPITASFRQAMQGRVLEAYRAECELAGDSGRAPVAADTDSRTGAGEAGGYGALDGGLGAGGQGGERRGGDEAAAGDRGAPAEDTSGWRRPRGRGRGRPPGREPEARPVADDRVASTSPGSDAALSETGEPASVEPDIGAGDSADRAAWKAALDEPITQEAAGPSPADSEQAPGEQLKLDETDTEPAGDDDSGNNDSPFGAGLL